jgi:hypothetical protein
MQSPIISLQTRLIRMVIRLKRIYNFLCSMLVYTQFSLCFVTLYGLFMHFPELTYYRDTTVPVPYFLLFLCFRKVTQEIFSELDEMKPEPPIFPDTRQSPKESQRGPGTSHTLGWRGWTPGRAPLWCGAPSPPLTSPLRL